MEKLLELADKLFDLIELPKNQCEWIKKRLKEKIDNGSIINVEEMYSFVTETVDNFSIPLKDKFVLKLDRQINKENKNTFHDIIPSIEPTPLDILTLNETDETLLWGDVYDILVKEIDVNKRKVLDYIFPKENKNLPSPLTIHNIKTELPIIIDRLEILTEKLYRGKILIPMSKIVHISFENNKLVLDYRGKLTSEKIDFIYESYKKDRSAFKTAQILGIAHSTILDIWKKSGLEPKFKKWEKRISDDTLKKILQGYKDGLDINKTANFAGVSSSTTKKYWLKNGFYIYKNSRWAPKLTENQRDNIIKAHNLKLTISEAAKYAKVNHKTISVVWAQKNLQAHGKHQKLSDQTISKIYEAHTLGMTVHQSMKYADVSEESIIIYWAEKGLKPIFNKKARNNFPKEKVEKIIDSYESGMTQKEAAEYVNISEKNIRKQWGLMGFPRRTIRRRRLPIGLEEKIHKALTEGKTNLDIIKEIGIDITTLRICLAKEGLENKNHYPPNKLKQKQINEIKEAYNLYKGNVSEAARHIPYSGPTILKYWRKYKIQILNGVN